ncbi:MAG: hypothetical protein QOG65_2868, partial [Actinomycetota bacterium]|nr:hypothetical protein [Actinomycetota bacterium]
PHGADADPENVEPAPQVDENLGGT